MIRYGIIVWMGLVFGTPSLAQRSLSVPVTLTLPSISMVDVEPAGTAINFTFRAPTEAGNTLSTVSADNSKWLNFTSAVAPNRNRRIMIQLSNSLPMGLSLRLTTSAYGGSGAGALGSRVSPITLTTTAQTLIQNIGGAFTGNGVNNGYNLSFQLQVQDFAQLRAQTATISVVYTIMDN
ncbi:MAG: hypothetical protein ACK4LB_01415 [Spirosomataceae bacterium]